MCSLVVSKGFNINCNASNGRVLLRFHCDVSAICDDPFARLHNKSSGKYNNSGTRNSHLVNDAVVFKGFCFRL
jgi:hypothetical protein